MKRFLTLITIVFFPLTLWFAFASAYEAQGERVPVKAHYVSKVVYDVTGVSDPTPLLNDCQKRGGVFMAASCAQCSPRCEFSEDERLIIPGWEIYRDSQVGVSFNHPDAMSVHKSRPTEVSLTMWGPTQKRSGDITDGISIRIIRETYPPILTFDEYVEERLLDAQAAGAEILSSYPMTIGRVSGEAYRTFKGKETVHFVIPQEGSEVIVVEYTVIDPQREGFERTLQRIISSIRINTTSL